MLPPTSTDVFERSVKDGVGELIPTACPLAGEVAHVLQDGGEGSARLLRQLLLVLQLLQQRQLQRVPRVSPQVVSVTAGGHLQTARHGPLRGCPDGQTGRLQTVRRTDADGQTGRL